jgi:hypothetical protein
MLRRMLERAEEEAVLETVLLDNRSFLKEYGRFMQVKPLEGDSRNGIGKP